MPPVKTKMYRLLHQSGDNICTWFSVIMLVQKKDSNSRFEQIAQTGNCYLLSLRQIPNEVGRPGHKPHVGMVSGVQLKCVRGEGMPVDAPCAILMD